MFSLLRSIYIEQARIDAVLNEENTQVEFYDSFFKNNDYTSIKALIKANKLDLAVAVIMTEHPELDANYVKQAVLDNRQFFESESAETLRNLTETLSNLHAAGYYKIIRDRLASGKKIELSDILRENGLIMVLFDSLLKTFDIEGIKFAPFMDLFESYPKDLTQALVTTNVLSEIKEEYQAYMQRLDEIGEENGKKIRTRRQDRVVNDLIGIDWNVENILEPVKLAREYYEKIKSEQKSKKKYHLKLRDVYSSLEKEISQAIKTGTEIKSIDKLLAKIDNENIRRQALRVVYEHNRTIYEETSKEYQRLISSSAPRYQVLLAKYGVSPEDYDVGIVMENSIEDLEKMLLILSNIGIKSPQNILQIASISNLETISNYKALIEKGIITSTLLTEYSDLLDPASKQYESFMRNLDLIRERKLNPLAFRDSEKTLTIPHKTFSKSLETVYAYDLQSQIKTGTDLSFLGSKSLDTSIDTLLELGYETYLVEDISLLNYSSRFNRLRLMKALNHEISSKEELLGILSSEKFFVPDAEIKNYIYNSVPYSLPSNVEPLEEPKKKNPDLTRLTEYESTPRTYVINGVIFSKNKTARNLSLIETSGKTSDRLLYGLLKDTVLTDEEVKSVKNTLVPTKTTNQFIKKA